MFLSPVFIAFLAALAVLFFFIGLTKPKRDEFEINVQNQDLYQKIQLRLVKAGLVETSPVFIVSGTLTLMVFILFIGSLLAGNVIIGVVAAALTPLVVWYWLNRQERKFLDRANTELVPFLRQIEAQVVTGQNASQAFRFAVERSSFFRVILRDSMNDLRLNRPFLEVLNESVELVPTKGWAQFVKALNIQVESGGDLASMISSSVDKINTRLRMQETIRGKYRSVAGQQNIILLAGIAVPVFFFMSSPEIFANLIGSVIGLFGLIGGVTCIILSVLYSRRIVKDIEEKINY